MRKWMPLNGNFIAEDKSLIFLGATESSNNNMPNAYVQQNAPSGIVLFEDMISSGIIEATVSFEKFDKDDVAQIIFNYQNELCYMCAGIANTPAKYGFNYINGQAFPIRVSGIMETLPTTHFDMRLQIMGSILELYVNEIKVLTSDIPAFVNRTQVGLIIKSKHNVTISEFKTNYKKPEAFIVSQFGGDYDVLYEQVIKPVCKELDYDPIRGDEMVSCSMILSDIITSIQNSAVIVADITPDNPNVFYEIGYAHALNKPTILLCERTLRDKLPFDVSGFRTIFYDNSIGGKTKVEEKLKTYLQTINITTRLGGRSF